MRDALVLLVIGLVIGFMLGSSCKRSLPPETTSTTDTVRIVEVQLVMLDPIAVDVPPPDTVEKYLPAQPDPIDFKLDMLRTYSDTVKFDGLRLGYQIKTRGQLQSAVFHPFFEQKTVIKTIKTTEYERAAPLKGLFVGVNIGGNKTQFGTFGPQIDYVTSKNIYRANYNLIDGTVNIGISHKIF